MFYYLNGTVAALDNCLAVIDCGGVGFSCNTSMRSLAALEIGQKVKLYTSCVIREDTFDIYGFTTQAELNSFRMLTGISGVGPKAALSILSSSSSALARSRIQADPISGIITISSMEKSQR